MTSYTISPIWGAGAQLFDNSGNVLTGGKIYTYYAGSTTPLTTYTNPTGTIANTNPIIANAAGRLTNEIWFPVSGAYKFVLKDANDVLIATYDNIPTTPQPPVVNDASSVAYEPVYEVTAGGFTVGATYLITSVGTTDFVAIGAAANVTGIHFTATGVGSGTGTAEYSRTVQAKLRETVSVKDFGAVGDGVADDSAALQAAALHVSTNGGALYLPAGTYFITDHFAITGSNVRVYGDGMGASVIKVGAWVDGILIAKDGANYPSGITGALNNVTIEHLTIDGNRAGYPNGPNDTYGNGVNFVAVDNVTVQNVEVKDAAEQGIASTYWVLTPGDVQESLVIDSCVVLNTQQNRISIGVEGQGRSAKVTNNTVAFSNNAVVGIYLGYVNGSGINNGYSAVSNNVINGSGINSIGVKIEENMYNVTVANNVINGCAISIRASSGTQSTFGYTITGNQCIDWSTHGILVWPMKAGDAALSVISNNRILAASPAVTSYGIYVDSKAHCIGNIVYSALTAGIYVEGDNCLITANEIDTPSGFSVDFSNSAGSYICGNKISTDVNFSLNSTFFMNIGAAVTRSSFLNVGVNRIFSGDAAPVSGSYIVGDIFLNSAPQAGSLLGWICITAGTPGTWVTFGGIASANTWGASNVIADRSFDASTVTLAELGQVVGTLVEDLRTSGILS